MGDGAGAGCIPCIFCAFGLVLLVFVRTVPSVKPLHLVLPSSQVLT